MEEKELKSWEEFPKEIERIRVKYGEVTGSAGKGTLKNKILFRGQANNTWHLQTTLERSTDRPWTIAKYTELAIRCATQITSFTDRFFDLPSYQEAEKEIFANYNEIKAYVPPSIYKLWIYLRHHGFPSPLLDWTLSPYIAAYFSFAEKPTAEKTSVFAYIGCHRGTTSNWVEDSKIETMDPYVATHKRHFIQQCLYTIATKPQDGEHHFVCHEDIFTAGSTRQDVLIKINIPTSERMNALKFLNDANINFFRLFQTEDSLVRSLAFREIEMNL